MTDDAAWQASLAGAGREPKTGAELFKLAKVSPNRARSTLAQKACGGPVGMLLSGTDRPSDVIEIAGRPQSGRTAIALYSILQRLLDDFDTRAVFLHTSPTFTHAQRCRDILRSLVDRKRRDGYSFDSEEGQALESDDVALSVLERLSVVHPFTASQALEALEAELVAKNQAQVSVVVLDTVDALLGGDALTSTSSEGHAILVDFMRRLHALAKSPEHPLTVYLVNSAQSVPAAELSLPSISRFSLLHSQRDKPTLGSTFTYLCDVTLWCTRAETVWGARGQNSLLVEVARNRHGPVGAWLAYEIIHGQDLKIL